MIDQLDIRFGKICGIKALSEKADSPRRKFCVIKAEFPGVGVLQSVGQFARHKTDMLGGWALCLINLGTKNMFGHMSEMLVLGVPHPDGGIIGGDGQEAQATYLRPAADGEPAPAGPRKPMLSFDAWLAADLRLGEVVEQSPEALQVRVSEQIWLVPLIAALGFSAKGQNLIVARDPDHPLKGFFPQAASGELLLARPQEVRAQIGSKVY